MRVESGTAAPDRAGVTGAGHVPSIEPARVARGGRVPADRYRADAFRELEAQRLWPRVWQLVGREAQVAEPGDWLTHDVGPLSMLVVRQRSGELRAFHNACPHRGNRLADGCGSTRQIVCGFHRWAFDLDGRLLSAPEREDFPPFEDAALGLVPVAVDTWGGFVFACADREAPPLRSWLAGIDAELAPYRFEDMACFLRRRLHLPANWKTCLDAFQEVYHVRGVHPQLLPGLKTADSTFAFWGPHSLMVNPNGDPALRGRGGPEDPEVLAGHARARARAGGLDVSQLDERRVTANYQYHLFPNVSFNTHATGCQLFRFLPHPTQTQACVLEVWFMERHGTDAPPPGEAGTLEIDLQGTRFSASLADVVPPPGARSFGQDLVETYALALDQDFARIPEIQRGLRSPAVHELLLSSQEQRILHWNLVLDGLLAGLDLDPALRARCAD